MASNQDLPPVPFGATVLDPQGFVSPLWGAWFRQLFTRVGQHVALTNLQLATTPSTPSVVGSRGAPTAVTAAGGVPFTASGATINFIAGNLGPVVVSKNPQIQAGTVVGQLLKLVGCNNSNTVELQTGTGLQLAGAIVLGSTTGAGLNSTLDLVWDGSVWVEFART